MVPAENVYPSATGMLPTVRSIVSANTVSLLPNTSLPVLISYPLRPSVFHA